MLSVPKTRGLGGLLTVHVGLMVIAVPLGLEQALPAIVGYILAWSFLPSYSARKPGKDGNQRIYPVSQPETWAHDPVGQGMPERLPFIQAMAHLTFPLALGNGLLRVCIK